VFAPLDFIARLAALVPKPRLRPLVRFLALVRRPEIVLVWLHHAQCFPMTNLSQDAPYLGMREQRAMRMKNEYIMFDLHAVAAGRAVAERGLLL
jgi:hypothetical protein